MSANSRRERFGVGPIGVGATIIIWGLFYRVEALLSVPRMSVAPFLRLLLLIMFLVDAVYLVGGGIATLRKYGWGKKLITTGPFMFVRHPLYSALIFSATGALALGFYSWALLVSAIPLSFFWSWLVTFEERRMHRRFGKKYEQYCSVTGQFFPSLKNLEDKFSANAD